LRISLDDSNNVFMLRILQGTLLPVKGNMSENRISGRFKEKSGNDNIFQR